jgi:hypothetical protein
MVDPGGRALGHGAHRLEPRERRRVVERGGAGRRHAVGCGARMKVTPSIRQPSGVSTMW